MLTGIQFGEFCATLLMRDSSARCRKISAPTLLGYALPTTYLMSSIFAFLLECKIKDKFKLKKYCGNNFILWLLL